MIAPPALNELSKILVFFFFFFLQMTFANPSQFGSHMTEQQYMEQEEEWEREGLLDPAWEKQQRKVRKKGL